MNKDANKRDRLIFGEKYSPGKYIGGLRKFKNIDADTLRKLIEDDFADRYDAQNMSPMLEEFLNFIEEHPKFKVHGYAVSPERFDYRITVEGVSSAEKLTNKEMQAAIEKFRFADYINFDLEEGSFHCWYD